MIDQNGTNKFALTACLSTV